MHLTDVNKTPKEKARWKLQAILKKYWKQHTTKQHLYGHLPPVSKTLQVRRTKHVEHCWRSKEVLLRPLHMEVPVLADLQELIYIFADTGCSLEDLSEERDNRDGWGERKSKKSVPSAPVGDDEDEYSFSTESMLLGNLSSSPIRSLDQILVWSDWIWWRYWQETTCCQAL